MADRKNTTVADPPKSKNLRILESAAKGCTACPLYKTGTQTVFGDGGKSARLMIVGEQPGDQEDLAGKPFVGPAGKLLRELLVQAKVPERDVYFTNAVKHFKWVPSGKRRLHQKPNTLEIRACHPWLDAEIRATNPAVILCLGATAAFSIFGKTTQLGVNRGKVFKETRFSDLTDAVLVSWHPSSILRAPDPESRHQKEQELVQDLVKAWKLSSIRQK